MSNEQSSKTDSNYYFFKTTPAEQAAQYRPQQIAADAAKEATPANNNAGSSWNTAGTWEEVNITQWSDDYFENAYKAFTVEKDGITVTVDDVDTEGSSSIVWTRGQKKVSFDYDITIKWTATVDGKEANAESKLIGIDGGSVDDFTIKHKSSDSSDSSKKVLTVVKTADKKLRAIVQDYIKEAILTQ